MAAIMVRNELRETSGYTRLLACVKEVGAARERSFEFWTNQ